MAASREMPGKRLELSEPDLCSLVECIENIDYGSVTLIIQDSKVEEMEKIEKIRIQRNFQSLPTQNPFKREN